MVDDDQNVIKFYLRSIKSETSSFRLSLFHSINKRSISSNRSVIHTEVRCVYEADMSHIRRRRFQQQNYIINF